MYDDSTLVIDGNAGHFSQLYLCIFARSTEGLSLYLLQSHLLVEAGGKEKFRS